MHKEITGRNKIYDINKAWELYCLGRIHGKQYTHRQLSLMKQENIKEALQKRYRLSDIKYALIRDCGYCFKYIFCDVCPIYKKQGKSCFKLTEWERMFDSKTKKEFQKYHRIWCKKIGLDVYKER